VKIGKKNSSSSMADYMYNNPAFQAFLMATAEPYKS